MFGESELNLDKEKLASFLEQLHLSNVDRQNWLLEYISAKSELGIAFRIYEDGLIVLETESGGHFLPFFKGGSGTKRASPN